MEVDVDLAAGVIIRIRMKVVIGVLISDGILLEKVVKIGVGVKI